MPTFKQITQYMIADKLLNEEIQTRFINSFPESLQEDLDSVYSEKDIFVPSIITGLPERLNHRYSDLYLNELRLVPQQ